MKYYKTSVLLRLPEREISVRELKDCLVPLIKLQNNLWGKVIRIESYEIGLGYVDVEYKIVMDEFKR